MKKIKNPIIKLLTLLMLFNIFMLTSCGTPQKVAYFQDVQESVVIPSEPQQIKIEPNDKLTIIVKTMDPTLSALFNLQVITERSSEPVPFTQSGGNMTTTPVMSQGIGKYTVSPSGYIDFPLLGQIKVSGMNRSELAGYIKGELMGRQLAKDPVVTVEFVNMGVSMLGEVVRPGRYDINQDQINIVEALAMAGDLTLQGKRDNIIVLRETDRGVETYRIDLTNYKEMTQSPAYYLKQGDIIYVEPNDLKKRQTTNNGNNILSTGFWISVASLLTSVVTTIAVFIRK